MIENPLDENGKTLFFAGAPCPDVRAHRAATLDGLVRMLELDPGYARWRAGQLGRENPDWHGDLLQRLDAVMVDRNIPRPRPFTEPPNRLPLLATGRRALKKRKYFHDTLP